MRFLQITKPRDPASGVSHLIGALLSVVALFTLLSRGGGHPWSLYHEISFSVFGVAMIMLYSFSALYHWLNAEGRRLEFFRKIDHIMIFVFIAASYTPICLINLRHGFGWWLLALVWTFTIGGFFMKIFWLQAPRILYTSVYLVMGWSLVFCIGPLIKLLPSEAFIFLALEGLFYSTGAVIYAIKKPDPFPKVFGFHEIFHVFIMLGSLSHFLFLYWFI